VRKEANAGERDSIPAKGIRISASSIREREKEDLKKKDFKEREGGTPAAGMFGARSRKETEILRPVERKKPHPRFYWGKPWWDNGGDSSSGRGGKVKDLSEEWKGDEKEVGLMEGKIS